MPRKKALRLLDELVQELDSKFEQLLNSGKAVEEIEEHRDFEMRKANRIFTRIALNEDFELRPYGVIFGWVDGDSTYVFPARDLNRVKDDNEHYIRQLIDYKNQVSDPNEYDDYRTGKVFVIHGHGDRQPIAQALEELGLEPVVLIEEAGGSKTIIEKLEQYAEDVDYAVALFTPDDQGRKNGVKKYHDRARQNVILETGFFLAAKGREYVCILKSPTVSLVDMSDLQGVITIDYGENTDWKAELRKYLEAADVI
jgi:predicted nucleotide-binding protein